MGDKSERRKQFLLRKLASGNIMESEHWELTKLAQDDPFLSEAIDGYRAEPISHETHLASLRRKLDTTASSTNAWRRRSVAAGFLLIIGVGLSYYFLADRSEDATQLAMQNVTQERDPSSDAPSSQWQNEEKIGAEEGGEISASTPAVAKSDDIDADGAISLSKRKEIPPSQDKLPEAELYTDASLPAESQHVESVELETKPTEDLAFSKPEIEREDRQVQQTSQSPVPSERAAGTVSHARSKAVRQPSEEADEAFTEIRPLIGWKRFKEEVQDKLVYPPAALKAQVEGVVRLSFYLSAERRPTDIKVLQSLGFGCDQEAIRVLEKGPQWQGKSDPNRRITVDIPFSLPKSK